MHGISIYFEFMYRKSDGFKFRDVRKEILPGKDFLFRGFTIFKMLEL